MATKIVVLGWCDRRLGTFWCQRLKKGSNIQNEMDENTSKKPRAKEGF